MAGTLVAPPSRMRLAATCCAVLCLNACERQPAASKPAASAPAASVVSVTPPVPGSAAAPAAPALSGEPDVSGAEVHLPPGLAADRKVPLLMMLHSLGTSAEDIQSRTDWTTFAEQNGIAWLAPNGPIDGRGRRFWDAGPSCCNFDGPPRDHVAVLRALLEESLARHPIDRERVYVGGISNGGFMAHRLACAAPELVRGVVSISGAGPLETASCQSPSSLRVLEVHGDADPIVSYQGGHLFKDPSLPQHASAEKTVRDWAERLGCRSDPVAGEPVNLETRFPGYETRVSRYERCTRGRVELWTVTGGNHYLAFRTPAPEVIWQFLTK
jgi:polyhydroxybutyrate depolymerase